MTQPGRTIALYADSGAGKTTQEGELFKFHFKRTRQKSVLYTSDMGGYDSIAPLERLGVMMVDKLQEGEDPWGWINRATHGLAPDGKPYKDIASYAFDSGTSMSEILLGSCADLSAEGQDIGGRPAPKFKVKTVDGMVLKIGSNVDSHYNVVQGYMLKKIWNSTYLTESGADVLWSFAVHRGENAAENQILGPKLAGKALTAAIPKWFNYTFRIAAIPVLDGPTRHVLYLQEQPEGNSLTFGNARYPLAAATPLPVSIEPANLMEALELIEAGQQEADDALREELGL